MWFCRLRTNRETLQRSTTLSASNVRYMHISNKHFLKSCRRPKQILFIKIDADQIALYKCSHGNDAHHNERSSVVDLSNAIAHSRKELVARKIIYPKIC